MVNAATAIVGVQLAIVMETAVSFSSVSERREHPDHGADPPCPL
jgi:hypothetical protein